MAERPKGFGMTAELQKKQDSKYDPVMEGEARQWINAVLEEPALKPNPDKADFYESLKDGIILCKLIEKLHPGTVPKYNTSKMAFKMMENIGKFLEACETIGVKKNDLFQTVDLYENQNIPQVINGIHALGRRVTSTMPGFPSLGPREASAHKREFSEDQLREGRNVIGLQMGTNRGASQSGMTAYGAGRQIIDHTSQK